ncbi:M81 family metallopeptidase [Oceanimonas baumannii]|uniref:M81 family metallopeptidase n=1 Tax=Oceanimonas baumannii TaxID=129578 RepID=UPI003A936AE0
MRFVIARMNHETNTFSPVSTPLAAFEPAWGEDAERVAQGSCTAMGAFLAYASKVGAEVVTPVFATANPSGRVTDDAWKKMSDAILSAVERGCDAVLLDLHGAMVTESYQDGEGELLKRIRKIDENVPVGVALDLHANISDEMVNNSDVLIGFKTYPHVDMEETGAHVAGIIDDILSANVKPEKTWVHPPQLAHTLMMNTNVPGAMQEIIDAAVAFEKQQGVYAVSVFGGFPLADVEKAGMSIVVLADSLELADSIKDKLKAQLWSERERFIYYEGPLVTSISEAMLAKEKPGAGPVLLLDHGDNCMSGGTCDTMDVIAEALRQGLSDIIAGPVCDPFTVERMYQAGVGKELTLSIGNVVPLFGNEKAGPGLKITGKVMSLTDGKYTITGPTYTGMVCSMGRAAVLDAGDIKILITEKSHEPWDIGVYQSVGLEPQSCDYLIMKSRMYCRPVFEPIAKALVECASAGVTSSNYELFKYIYLERPVYPLDAGFSWG